MPVKKQHSRGPTREKSSQRAPGMFVCVYGKCVRVCACVCAYMRVMPRYFPVNFVAVQAFRRFRRFPPVHQRTHAQRLVSLCVCVCVSVCRGKRAEKAAV
jgi:hypothetical protein